MKTQVLTIKPQPDVNSLEVSMAIGECQHQFTFSREFDQIGDRQLQIITYNRDFGETFKYNQHIVAEVTNLVRQFYKGEEVKLPQEVGDFGTPSEALALQKPFKIEKTLDKSPIL
jgi:hypothetical protein